MNYLETFVVAVVVYLIFAVVPKLISSGERKKKEHISNQKVYYGFFRMVGLYFLAFISSEIALWVSLTGIEIDGLVALLLVFLLSILFMMLYLHFYRCHYYKLIEKYSKNTGQE